MGGFFAFYRKHFGGTESTAQLYAGFGVFLVGMVLCLGAAATFLLGDLIFDLPSRGWINQERIKLPAFLSLLGLPLLLFGIQLTMPSRKIVHLASGAGSFVCLWYALRFNATYPGAGWLTGGAVEVIGGYTAGLALLVATTGVGLVINFVSRYVVLPGQEVIDPFDEYGRDPTTEEILADIEREMERANISWGGMDSGSGPRNFVKMQADFGADAFVSKGRSGIVTELPADDTTEAGYVELLRMRGRDLKQSSEADDTDAAMDALVALRQARQQEMERSWWYRFKRWFFSLFLGTRRRRGGPEAKNRTIDKARKGDTRGTSSASKDGKARVSHAKTQSGAQATSTNQDS